METKNKNTISNANLAPIIIGKLLNIGGVLQRMGDRMLFPFDLNQQQFSIFFEIARAGEVKQKDIVNRLLLERAHISKVVKKLKNLELIYVKNSDQDNRSYWLSITPKGEQVLNNCIQMFDNWNAEWINEIEASELSDILDNLTKLQTIFNNKFQKS